MTVRAKYIRIPPEKWKRYQTKERPDGWKPPWFKMWNALLDDAAVRLLEPEERWVFVGILCLANETANRVLSDAKVLAFRLSASQELIRVTVPKLVANGLVEPLKAKSVETVAKPISKSFVPEVPPKIEDRGKKLEDRKTSAVRTEAKDVAEQHPSVDRIEPPRTPLLPTLRQVS